MLTRKPRQHHDEKFFVPRGRLPERDAAAEYLDSVAAGLAKFYGFEKAATSVIDDAQPLAALAKAKLLEERMPVTWKMRTGEELALRVSGALAILRSYVNLKMNDLPHPLKFSFEGESFFLGGSFDRQNNGRIESVEERGLMMIGEETTIAEAEIIHVIWKTFADIGIPSRALQLSVNAIGCAQCRGHFRSSFLAYFRTRGQRLCRNCRRDLKRFPTRVLLCGEDKCRMLVHGAPQVLDFLCETCKKHLRGVLEFLDEAGVPYFLDSRLFREGSWFSQLVFEVVFRPELSTAAESVLLAEGGRVSHAGELIVGRRIDAVSGVIILDALERVCTEQHIRLDLRAVQKVFLAQLGDLAKRKSLGLMEMLRQGGIGVMESLGRDSMKSQLKVAERVQAEIALILGQKEALNNTVIVRDVSSGMQETVPQEKLVEFLKRRISN
ncbi:MAG: hypothetical protein HY007_01765 [Candidatus Sungbacteria bacterium]|nr:hypothetical protein [Candidatus Sungbacteria bacterium]